VLDLESAMCVSDEKKKERKKKGKKKEREIER
jgi:ribosomal protein S9